MKYLLMGVVCVGLVSFASASIIGTDSFDYADGPIAGQSGGTGWSGADGASDWDNWWGATDVASGALTTGPDGGAHREFGNPEYDSAVQGTGQVFFAVTMTVNDTQGGAGWGGLSSFDFGTEKTFFGRPWQDSYWDEETNSPSETITDGSNGFGYYGITGDNPGALTSIAIESGVAARIIGCVDFDGDKVLMWVNPDASDYYNLVSGQSSADAQAEYLGGNWISGLRLAAGGSITWDDLVVATDGASVGIVPEPATLALLGVGALLGLKRKK